MKEGLLGDLLRRLGLEGAADRERFDTLDPDLPDADAARVSAGLRDCLMGRGGRAATRVRYVALGRAYVALGADGRRRYRDILARDFAADGAAAHEAIADLDEFGEWRGLFSRRYLTAVMDPPRRRLLRAFHEIPGGPRLLELMRSEVRDEAADGTPLADLAGDLDEVLGTRIVRPPDFRQTAGED